jgi:hypothetical protein
MLRLKEVCTGLPSNWRVLVSIIPVPVATSAIFIAREVGGAQLSAARWIAISLLLCLFVRGWVWYGEPASVVSRRAAAKREAVYLLLYGPIVLISAVMQPPFEFAWAEFLRDAVRIMCWTVAWTCYLLVIISLSRRR